MRCRRGRAILTVRPTSRTALPAWLILDALDHTLLGLLRADARLSVADLAKKLAVSRATVGNRIKRLEQSGVIVGYTVRLRPDAEPREITAWVSIAVEGDRTREVVRLLLGEPAVSALHDTNGRWDLLAEVHAASITELSEVLERIRTIKGIETTETSIHLQTFCRG
jgi:DNA-binding Lrp family transcriptional regulator